MLFNITNHQGNANQNHNEISPHTCQNGYHQKDHKLQMLVRMWRKGNLVHCWWECKLVQPLCKTVWRFLKKLKIALPYEPAIPFLGIYPGKKKQKNSNQKRYVHPNVHSSNVYDYQDNESILSVHQQMN